MSPPKELYTAKTLFTLGGASFSVLALTGAMSNAFGWRPAWLGLVFAEVLAFAGLFLFSRDERRSLQLILVAFCNGLLIYTQATGFNTLNQGLAPTKNAKTATLLPVFDRVPWWPPADQKLAANELIVTTQKVVRSIDESIAPGDRPAPTVAELSIWREQLVQASNKLATAYGTGLVAHSGEPQPRVTPTPDGSPYPYYLLIEQDSGPYKTSPTATLEFTIDRDVNLSFIGNVHLARPETTEGIRLRRNDGTVFGPWPAAVASTGHQFLLFSQPNVKIPPGTYTVIDPVPNTWAVTQDSQNKGVSVIHGELP